MNSRTGKRVSTTRVGKLLAQWGFVNKAFTARDLQKGTNPRNVSNETYGQDSELYVTCKSVEDRAKLLRLCRQNDINVNPSWNGGTASLNIGVSYFRGHHWNE